MTPAQESEALAFIARCEGLADRVLDVVLSPGRACIGRKPEIDELFGRARALVDTAIDMIERDLETSEKTRKSEHEVTGR